MERRMGGTQDSLGEACEGGSRWGQRQQTGWVTWGRGSMHTPPAKARDFSTKPVGPWNSPSPPRELFLIASIYFCLGLFVLVIQYTYFNT